MSLQTGTLLNNALPDQRQLMPRSHKVARIYFDSPHLYLRSMVVTVVVTEHRSSRHKSYIITEFRSCVSWYVILAYM